ncbi:MAG TPA: ParB/Srx family N-terminal domain-containing protein [Roseiarcus sp.]|nr:ParB/Srx family N-terminal domain-containing protein [Roseiarcus sp.]
MTIGPSAASIAVSWRPVAGLKPNPHNARVHSERQVAAIADSIAAFGFNVPLLIDGESRVLAGHGRLLAAERLGLDEVPTIMLAHLDDAARRGFMIADNRLAEFASWDSPLLGLELKQLGGLDLDFALSATGFSLSEIDLMIDFAPAAPSSRAVGRRRPGGPRPDESLPRAQRGGRGEEAAASSCPAPHPSPAIAGSSPGPSPGTGKGKARPVARAGDAWRLGPHRLLCGEGDDDAFLAVDDAIRRWQAQSGESARLESTKESFAATARGRRPAKLAHAAR